MSQEISNMVSNIGAVQDGIIPVNLLPEGVQTLITAPASTLPTVNVTPVVSAVAPTNAIICNVESTEGYLGKLQNYVKSMSTRNYYIALGILVLFIAGILYYVWNKFFSKKPSIKSQGVSNEFKNREMKELKGFDPFLDPRMDPRNQINNPNFRYPETNPIKKIDKKRDNDTDSSKNGMNKKDKFSPLESSDSSNKNKERKEKSTKNQIFSNQYDDVYVGGESLDRDNNNNDRVVVSASNQRNTAIENNEAAQQVENNLLDVPNYDPDNATNN